MGDYKKVPVKIAGKEYHISCTEEEEYIQRFSSQEWDCFEPEQQLQFENATLYWVIY